MTRSARRTVLTAGWRRVVCWMPMRRRRTGCDAGGERPRSGAVPGVCRAAQAPAREQGISQGTLTALLRKSISSIG
ncbi:hypothetical protein M8494_07950 [Serratia ureilytica]